MFNACACCCCMLFPCGFVIVLVCVFACCACLFGVLFVVYCNDVFVFWIVVVVVLLALTYLLFMCLCCCLFVWSCLCMAIVVCFVCFPGLLVFAWRGPVVVRMYMFAGAGCLFCCLWFL